MTRVQGRKGSLLAVLVFAPVMLSVAGAHAMDVTACNQTVPRGVTGNLVSDLDCSLPYGSYAVVLSQGARLELNGFTLSSDADGVKCEGTCRISGPGTIARTQPSCSGQTVIDTYGVFGGGKVALDDVTLTSWGFATWASLRLNARNVHVDGQCDGLVGNYSTISVKDSVITNNAGRGIAESGRVKVSDSIITGNFADITAGKRPRVSRSTCVTSVGGPGAAPDTWGVCGAP